MNFSELCIRRPVMTTLMTLSIVFSGFIAWKQLPVAALPRADFPVISVSAVLPGASPETMASSVASILEREFATIGGIDSMTSTSGSGSSIITLQFALERNIDDAANDVQAALARAARRLPAELTTPPSFRKVNPADQPVILLALTSPVLPLSTLNELAETVLQPRIATQNGVAQVQVYGAQRFAVRIQIDPDALSARGIGIDDVQKAITAANANTPVGTLSGPHQQLTIETNRQLLNAEAFRPLVVAFRNGAPVRLSDVATVIDSVQNNRVAAWFNGVRAIVLAIQRQPDANTVEVVDRVRTLMPALQQELPAAVSLEVMSDRSLSIRDAVHDVQFTLFLTIGLVVLVIFLFLRRLSATLIPALALPVSLIATYGGMFLLSYSLDNISLLGLTLSVGLVVDDAIVMLENIVRHIENGEKPFEAALKGSREIGFTIVSITVSLVAVFIPILLMGGVVGRLFHEFAMVVTLAIGVSAFVSLTLTPMLCARHLRAEKHPHNKKSSHKEGFSSESPTALPPIHTTGWLRLYDISLRWALKHSWIMLIIFALTIVGTVQLFKIVPKGFFPIEDTGQISITTEAAPDVSFDALAAMQKKAAAIIQADPAVTAVTSSVGAGNQSVTANAGRMFITLKPREQRPPVGEVIQRLRRQTAAIPGFAVFIQPVQNLSLGGRAAKNLYQYTLQGQNLDDLYLWADRMVETLSREPIFQDTTSDAQRNNPQAFVHINRERAATLGVAVDQVRQTLYSAFGSRQVSTIFTPSNDYQVILELDPQFQAETAALSKLHVRSATSGRLVPLDAFANVERASGPLTVNHLSQVPAVTISFNLAPGHALGEAIEVIREVELKIRLPASVTTGFNGTTQLFQDSMRNQGLLLLAAVVVIYIVLGVLYESYIHPITILSGLPSATIGALGTLILFGQELSVIAIIGILMLIGIVKKNAIMMIDVALSLKREHGLPPEQAAYRACLMRFRPIMMTTLAAMMGTLPIAIGYGAAAELRQPLGLTVVGGLAVSQILTLYLSPVLYLHLEHLSSWTKRTSLKFTKHKTTHEE
ncbi:multidrug efflux pump RND permease subunit MdtB [Azospirillaceae bacterium]